jgi:hypothetical protein
VFGHDLKSMGVSFDTRSATSGPATARCLILVTPDAQRTMNTYLGACTGLGPNDIDTKVVGAAQVTYVEGYLWDAPGQEGGAKAFDAAHAHGRLVSITLSDLLRRSLSRVPRPRAQQGRHPVRQRSRDQIALPGQDVRGGDGGHAQGAKIAALTRSEKGLVVLKGPDLAVRRTIEQDDRRPAPATIRRGLSVRLMGEAARRMRPAAAPPPPSVFPRWRTA